MKVFIQKISVLLVLTFLGLIAHAQIIDVSISAFGQSADIANNATYDATQGGIISDVKSLFPVTVTITNTGSAVLTLTKVAGKFITVSGNGASDFTIDESTLTGSLAVKESQSFTVNLSSSATNGSNKTVTMSILNNSISNVSGTNAPFSYSGTIKYSLTSMTPVTTALTKASDIGLCLYPNPSADGHFFITANNITVDRVVVSNVSGVTQEFAAKEFSTSLKGLLLVQVYTDKGIVSEKVIIQE